MNFKWIILASIFLLAILTIGFASANENMTEELSSIDDEVTLEMDDLDTELTEENAAENVTFADLNQVISESEDLVVLKHDYSFNLTKDEGYKNGIEIKKSNMIIDGASHTIDGKGLARAFNVTGTNVTFKNIKFINGYSEDLGGSLHITGAASNIINCTFTNSEAIKDGGAIYLRVQNGIIRDSNFTGNKALYNGAIYMNSIEGTIYNCIFTNNTATDSAGALGWVKKENGTIADCTFKDNSAPRGGAIFLNNGTEFYISSTLFENNNASKNGGAIFWDCGNEGRIAKCEFKNNYAGESGGAIYWNKTENGYIYHSQFDSNKANDGGAIYFSESNGIITYSTFTNNTATSGGAIFNNGTININGNTFADNRADDGNDIAGNGKVKYNVEITIETVDNEYGKTVKIIVKLTNDGPAVNNGTVSVTVNKITYNATVKDATATIPISNLNAGSYDIDITYTGDSTYNNNTKKDKFVINKKDAGITGKARSYVINYGGKYSVTVNGLSNVKVIFRLNNKIIGSAITDKKGIAKISLTPKMLKTAKAGKRNMQVTLDNNNYQGVKNFKITINKEKTKITAKAKAFKSSVKTKKYTIYLKNSKGKAIKKVKVILKVKGKTYKVKTNSKGKATFKIKKLTKTGKYTAKINFKGNAYYKASSAKAKITVK
jgi:predicted outer membrane repeat protein